MTTDLFLVHIKEHEIKKAPTTPALTKTGRIKKRNYPAERKPRTKRSSLGIKQEEGIPEDDSSAEPLTALMRVQQNPEVCLEPTSEHSQVQLSEQLTPDIWQDLCNGLILLKSMPSKVDSDVISLQWDVALLKLECPKISFGIPGEKKCFKCEDFFVAIPEKQTHVLYTHQNDPYFCAICQQAFGKESSGVNHMINKHGDLWKSDVRLKVPENYTTCEICGLSCASDLAYWHHRFQSHKRYKNVGCPLCETSCNNFVLFLRHVLIKHGNYKYKCFLCDKTSKSMEAFKDHVKQHEKGKIKKENSIEGDDDEDEVFEREEIEINGKKILRKKIGKKGKKPPVACEICGTISKGAFNNARHLYTMHGIKREVQCDKCDTLCESVRAMLEHKKNHHSSASCHLCGKVFVEKGHLENHLMRHGIGKDGKNHQNERDFMCEICSKTFTRKNYLVIHMKNHAEKSIKCTVCSKMFRWNSALQAHLTAAHGMGPKEGACTCEFCGRQFQDKSNYRQHRYTHLQVKPFNCEACGKGFIRRDLMKSHKEKCHAATTFNMG
jgi:KRAB domain-containing zinc finger protein